MSAYRSFFVGASQGRFALRRSGDLWRLLVSITLRKLYRQARRHTAQRRSVGVEQSLERTPEESLPGEGREPTPEEAVALADELAAVMSQLDEFSRRVFELRLQGEPLAKIASDTGRAERTVRRALAAIRRLLAERFELNPDD